MLCQKTADLVASITIARSRQVLVKHKLIQLVTRVPNTNATLKLTSALNLTFAHTIMKPSLPQGTRDFNAATVRKRQYILNTIKHVFELYGYEPLETPSMENLSTLTGKYGEEGDRLIYKILNNGLQEPSKAEKTKAALDNVLKGQSDVNLTERALRYDLTIPFARYVAMNRNDLALPYKRYQMQAVWRADRPQKGRYREFWQCDADVIGSNSLMFEAELINVYHTVFEQLMLPQVHIKINNRKILAALAEHCNCSSQLTEMTVAIDKLDKIGKDGVAKELTERNISPQAIETIFSYLAISGSNSEQLSAITSMLGATELGRTGIEELQSVCTYLAQINSKCQFSFDFSLARGLDYYTGLIVEVATSAVGIGSIGGGGRYDNLTSVFDFPGVSGMGISFGVDRIYDVLEELSLFPAAVATSTKVMFCNFGAEAEAQSISYASTLRGSGVACEVYPDAAKFDKQLKYAHKRAYPFVAIVGETELKQNKINLKNFSTGMQELVSIADLINKLSL
jgi:histidyl-tRNA synthetase